MIRLVEGLETVDTNRDHLRIGPAKRVRYWLLRTSPCRRLDEEGRAQRRTTLVQVTIMRHQSPSMPMLASGIFGRQALPNFVEFRCICLKCECRRCKFAKCAVFRLIAPIRSKRTWAQAGSSSSHEGRGMRTAVLEGRSGHLTRAPGSFGKSRYARLFFMWFRQLADQSKQHNCHCHHSHTATPLRRCRVVTARTAAECRAF